MFLLFIQRANLINNKRIDTASGGEKCANKALIVMNWGKQICFSTGWFIVILIKKSFWTSKMGPPLSGLTDIVSHSDIFVPGIPNRGLSGL